VKIVLAVVGIKPQPSSPYPVTVLSCHLVLMLRMHGSILYAFKTWSLEYGWWQFVTQLNMGNLLHKTIWKMTTSRTSGRLILEWVSQYVTEVNWFRTEVEVVLRPTVSRPVCLGVRRPSGTCDQFFFLLEIFYRLLHVCYFVAPFLTRGRACNLLYNCFWVLPEQFLLGRSPAQLTTIFYCLIWDSPILEGQVPVFISPRNRVTQSYPRALGWFTTVLNGMALYQVSWLMDTQ
jgi:hypothetical protein